MTLDLHNKNCQTQSITLGQGTLTQAEVIYEKCFADHPAVIVADNNTWAAAGHILQTRLSRQRPQPDPIILHGDPILHPDMDTVERLHAALSDVNATPIALGSGTINDLVKLASHRLDRPYMVVATAASMDGYTAFGASITHRGSKQTFDCPAPRALLADIDIIAAAPRQMASTGYADLLAKIPAGADWILADALAIEPLNAQAWQLVQAPLHQWLANPQQIRDAQPAALLNLMRGLVASGLAMQITKNSRPASGAEHQFSHLWDMQSHTHAGQGVSHGSKVAIGALASCALYESLLELPLDQLDIEQRCRDWPTLEELAQRLRRLHTLPALQQKALEETRAKYIQAQDLRIRLSRLRQLWPQLRDKLRQQLLPSATIRQMLQAAGAPAHPQDIGIDPQQMRDSYLRAWSIRRRYTILDLARETGHFDQLIDHAFNHPGIWS